MQTRPSLELSQQLKHLFKAWRKGLEVEPQDKEIVANYVLLPEGEGLVLGLAEDQTEQRGFLGWLSQDTQRSPVSRQNHCNNQHQQESNQQAVIDPQQFFVRIFRVWKKGLEISSSDKDFAAHYATLPEGQGTLLGLADSREEQQHFLAWLNVPKTAAS